MALERAKLNLARLRTAVAADDIQEARGQAAAIAAAVLAGRVSAVLGAIDLNHLRPLLNVPEDDSDFQIFMVIDSECDALPLGIVRQHWSPEALTLKQPELARAEQWATETGKEAFTNVVARFAQSS
jgi:hypothetical protein